MADLRSRSFADALKEVYDFPGVAAGDDDVMVPDGISQEVIAAEGPVIEPQEHLGAA